MMRGFCSKYYFLIEQHKIKVYMLTFVGGAKSRHAILIPIRC